jgi:hypothetical protein
MDLSVLELLTFTLPVKRTLTNLLKLIKMSLSVIMSFMRVISKQCSEGLNFTNKRIMPVGSMWILQAL